jgi:predicted transglutaminase-like cysteine proteinase
MAEMLARTINGSVYLAYFAAVLRRQFQRLTRTACRIDMKIALFVTVIAMMAELVVPVTADDRPSDPFGNYTTELNKEAPIAMIWDSLRDKMLIEKGYFHKCMQTKDCPLMPELVHTLEEIRQYHGRALLGHLNLSVNLMLKPAPADWTTPLAAITMKHGDCKSYSIAKYAGAQELGVSADDLRLVIVHNRRLGEDHMVVAVYQDGEWLILDNLTNFMVPDSAKKDYEPLVVLDYKGARRYLSAFWFE